MLLKILLHELWLTSSYFLLTNTDWHSFLNVVNREATIGPIRWHLSSLIELVLPVLINLHMGLLTTFLARGAFLIKVNFF